MKPLHALQLALKILDAALGLLLLRLQTRNHRVCLVDVVLILFLRFSELLAIGTYRYLLQLLVLVLQVCVLPLTQPRLVDLLASDLGE